MPRINKWSLEVKESDMDEEHCVEKSIQHVDALSRNPVEELKPGGGVGVQAISSDKVD